MRHSIIVLVIGTATSIVHAQPKIEDVFKSTQENFGERDNSGVMLALFCAVAALSMLLLLFHRRAQREARPKVLNHQGKLLKEISKQINLKPAEMRQLRALAESQQVENPLTLLLCPSLLAKAAKEKPDKVDRKALAGMLKRMG